MNISSIRENSTPTPYFRHSERSGAQRNAVEEPRGASLGAGSKSVVIRRDSSTSLRSARNDSRDVFLYIAFSLTIAVTSAFAGPLAFPSAEGFGARATGGRGG